MLLTVIHRWVNLDRWPLLLSMVLALSFFAFSLAYSPLTASYDLDYDEGVNLAKTELHRAGYDLYAEIWSDQPPLFTALLASWFDILGRSVAIARTLVLAMSVALLWALFHIARYRTSIVAAAVTVILLAASEEYLRLSVSVMIGLPSLAVAVFSVLLLIMAKRRDSIYLLIGSSLLMAAAMQIKLMAATAVPAVAVYWLFVDPAQGLDTAGARRRAGGLLIWAGVLVLAYFGISAWFGASDPTQLLRPHLGTQTRAAFAQTQNVDYLRHVYVRHGLAVVLALLGLLSVDNWRKGQLLLPLTWLTVSTLLLLVHRPLWHHHVTLITIPLVWLSAFGVHAVARALHVGTRASLNRTDKRRPAIAFVLAIAAALVLCLYPSRLDRLVQEETYRALPHYDATTAETVKEIALDQPGMILTDRPFYAFQAGMLVTPPVAAFTRKRIEAGELTEDEIVKVIRVYQPQQILFERFVGLYSESIMTESEWAYCAVPTVESSDHFVRQPCGDDWQQ